MRIDCVCIWLLVAVVILVPMMVSGGPMNEVRPPAPAERPASASHIFQEAFDKYVHDDSIEGASYVVVENGRAVEWHLVGMADRDLRQAVDQKTIFHWGSITKTLTAVAV